MPIVIFFIKIHCRRIPESRLWREFARICLFRLVKVSLWGTLALSTRRRIVVVCRLAFSALPTPCLGLSSAKTILNCFSLVTPSGECESVFLRLRGARKPGSMKEWCRQQKRTPSRCPFFAGSSWQKRCHRVYSLYNSNFWKNRSFFLKTFKMYLKYFSPTLYDGGMGSTGVFNLNNKL